MAMIKCPECGNEMSDRAKVCPKCGAENDIVFCPECDKQLSRKATSCPHCGYVLQGNNNVVVDDRGENYGMALAALICSFFGISSVVGLILGIVALNSNKGLQNSARTMSIIAIIVSSVVLFIFIFVIFIIMISFSYYSMYSYY